MKKYKISMKNKKQSVKTEYMFCLMGAALLLCASLFGFTGCGTKTETSYEDFVIPGQEKTELVPVETPSAESYYKDKKVAVEETLKTVSSENGLCVINQKKDYYEVELDLEKGTHYEAGKAYAEAIKKVYPSFSGVMEPYLYENIGGAFPDLDGDYTPIEDRVGQMLLTMGQDYQEELKGFAEGISDGETGFGKNGKMSYEEAVLLSLIPDVLRGTQCSAVSIWGDKSQSGKPVTARILEWDLGNEKQMCTAHCVLKMKNGAKSFTGITVLGVLDLITGINEKGVFLGILDSPTRGEYSAEGKRSYSFDARYALEQFGTAKEVGEYLAGNGKQYTFSHNFILSDEKNSYAVENCLEEEGRCILRDNTTKLKKDLEWDNKDGLCVVNGFAAEGNYDNLTGVNMNIVRWKKFNEWMAAYGKMSVSDIKDLLTREDPEGEGSMIYSDSTFHIVIVDYATKTVEAAFTPVGTGDAKTAVSKNTKTDSPKMEKGEFPKRPVFVSLGTY